MSDNMSKHVFFKACSHLSIGVQAAEIRPIDSPRPIRVITYGDYL